MIVQGFVFFLLFGGFALVTVKPPSVPGGALVRVPVIAVTKASMPPQNRNSIQGRVTDTNNRPLERLRVELQDEVEMTITQTYTDSLGRYAFNNLSLGTFIVKVHSNGTHAGRSVRISLTPARMGGNSAHQELVDIALVTIEEARGKIQPNNRGVTFVQEVPESARKVYEKALNLLEQSKTEEGVEGLKEALKLFVDYFLAWERLGIEYLKLEHFEAAHFALTQAVRVNPNSADSLYGLGYAQYQLGKWSESAESLNRSLRLAPASPNAAFTHYYLGLALLKEKKLGESETHLKQAYTLGHNNIPVEVHLQLAQLYSNSKRYKEAADELEAYLKRAPAANDAENIRSLIKQLRGKEKASSSVSSK